MKKAYIVTSFVSTRIVCDEDLVVNAELAWSLSKDRLVNNLLDNASEGIEVEPDIEIPFGSLPGEIICSEEEYEIAQRFKDYLIALAVNDKLPLDLHELNVEEMAGAIVSERLAAEIGRRQNPTHPPLPCHVGVVCNKENLKDLMQFFIRDTRGGTPWIDADDEWLDEEWDKQFRKINITN